MVHARVADALQRGHPDTPGIAAFRPLSRSCFLELSSLAFDPQMSSCFLLTMKEDSIHGIYDTLKVKKGTFVLPVPN